VINRLLLASLASVSLAVAVAAHAHPAWGIVVTHAGDVFFSDLETVWRLDRQGRLTIAVAGTEGHHVHELGIDDDDNVYGVSAIYSQSGVPTSGLWRRDTAGHVVYLVAPTEQFPRGLGVWRDRRGTAFAVEENNNLKRETLLVTRDAANRVRLLAGGRYGFADGTAAAAHFRNIVGTTLSADGDVYLTDEFSVRRVSPAGVVTTIAQLDGRDADAKSPLSFGTLMGLAVTKARTLFVADFKQRRIVKLEPGRRPQVVMRAEPPWSPTGVAVAASGELYVLEVRFEPPNRWLKPRVRRLTPSGAVSTVAEVP